MNLHKGGKTRLLGWKRLVLVFCALILVLGALEIGFRVALRDGLYYPGRQDELIPLSGDGKTYAPYGFIPFVRLRSTYPTNPRGYFSEDNSLDHDFNEEGWRDGEHALEKPPGCYRILGLGDSYLFGQGVRIEDVCLSRLGPLLQAECPPHVTMETINTGIRGINTLDQEAILQDRGMDYDPDLVIVHFVLNDVETELSLYSERPQVDFFVQYLTTYMMPDKLSEYSYLWGWVRQQYLRHTRGNAYIRASLDNYGEDTFKWEACKRALEGIQAICGEKGAGLLVVIFPFFYQLDGDYPFQSIHDQVRSQCEASGIAVLDLREAYRSFEGPELWVHPVDTHPNEKAHAVAAEAIFQFLKKEGSRFPGFPIQP